MSLGRTPNHEDLFRSARAACEARLPETSLFRLLARESHRLFPDDAFADLFAPVGRRSIPPRIVAVVMVLQRMFGMSDREAVEAFAFDLRWKYAAGALDYDHRGFVHTVLVDMRARLRESERPNRIFEAVLEVAKEAGLCGRKRVLDSTALYDAVASQDTVTLIRSAIRKLLSVADAELRSELRAVLQRDDDYAAAGKPSCDWDDPTAREELIDALARDAYAALDCLNNRKLTHEVGEAAKLLATVVGQDLEKREDGSFCIAHRVARDRIISTVDPDARHGHKTSARGFDGYKAHMSFDPDSEIIVATEVTAANVADGDAAKELLTEVLGPLPSSNEEVAADAAVNAPEEVDADTKTNSDADANSDAVRAAADPDVDVDPDAEADVDADADADPDADVDVDADADVDVDADADDNKDTASAAERDTSWVGADVGPDPDVVDVDADDDAEDADVGLVGDESSRVEIYGDSSYGTAELVDHIEEAGAEANVKVQPPSGATGKFRKDDFKIDLDADTVTCPAGQLVPIRRNKDDGAGGMASFAPHCAGCPLRQGCTASKTGRKISVHPREKTLQRSRERQRDSSWKQRYRATRPKVERKFGHLMRRRHGGRRARVRGRERVGQDFALLAAAQNLGRLAVLGVHHDGRGWAC